MFFKIFTFNFQLTKINEKSTGQATRQETLLVVKLHTLLFIVRIWRLMKINYLHVCMTLERMHQLHIYTVKKG